jgi:hypothetical protein
MAGVKPGEVLLINAAVGEIPVSTGVRVIYADEESFTVMTPEGHPESGWTTFSAHEGEDGVTVAQVRSLAQANRKLLADAESALGATGDGPNGAADAVRSGASWLTNPPVPARDLEGPWR